LNFFVVENPPIPKRETIKKIEELEHMPLPEQYSFTRYLAAKKSVDDRALNQGVWQKLAQELARGSAEAPLRVLELGAGGGAMFERMLAWGLLQSADYTALDTQAENIAYARRRLPEWARRGAYRVEEMPAGELVFSRGSQRVRLRLEVCDVFDFIARERAQRSWDLLVAHAFLDLVDIPASLPQIFSLSAADGLYYFTINFDGATLLEPAIDPELDEQVEKLYHRSMDDRLTGGKPSGDSRSGRRLFAHLREAGATILAAGASDWVVFPGAGGYPQDEGYFLHYIVHTIQEALTGHTELEPARFAEWVAERHEQIERGALVYIAHQLDFTGRVKDVVADISLTQGGLP